MSLATYGRDEEPTNCGEQRPGRFSPRRGGWLSSLIVAVDGLWFGGDGNLNVSTLFEPHIIAIFVS